MDASLTASFLQLISAAITPVVMISACATLILGVNNKHSALADRMRLSAAECRQPTTSPERRSQLLEEIPVFYRRFRYTWFALNALYGAVAAFILCTLLILLTQQKLLSGDRVVLTLFMAGVALMLCAAIWEFAETALASRSLRIEMRDVLPPVSRRGH